MIEFAYKALPWNIIFGPGSLNRLPDELESLGFVRSLILTTPRQRQKCEDIARLLGSGTAAVFDQARMHVPVEALDEATARAHALGADCTISLGGGSTTGLGKALAVRQGLPNIAIPTTYAGSEMTDIWAVTERERKVTARDVRAVPNLTIYDPELTISLPTKLAIVSGLNALAQAVVNVATDNPNPIVSSLALEGIRALTTALPAIKSNPEDLEARSKALFGASMAGAALGTGSTGLHHRLCHTLGGTFNTPHAETHAILLAHSVAYNRNAAAEGTHRVATLLGTQDAAIGIYKLAKSLGAPLALSEIGISESDLDKAADITAETPINNPEPVTRGRIRALLQDAYLGRPPDVTSPA